MKFLELFFVISLVNFLFLMCVFYVRDYFYARDSKEYQDFLDQEGNGEQVEELEEVHWGYIVGQSVLYALIATIVSWVVL